MNICKKGLFIAIVIPVLAAVLFGVVVRKSLQVESFSEADTNRLLKLANELDNEVLHLSDDEIAFYRNNGYLVVRGVVSDSELEALKIVSSQVHGRPNVLTRKALEKKDTPECGFAVSNFALVELYRPFVMRSQMAALAAQVMGTSKVVLGADTSQRSDGEQCGEYESKIHVDMDFLPYGPEKKMHYGDNMVQVIIPIDGMGGEGGKYTLNIYPGSHSEYVSPTDTYNSDGFCSFASNFTPGTLEQKYKKVDIQASPGDIVLQHGGVFHVATASKRCTALDCRRLQLSWYDAETTVWRDDVPMPRWPFIFEHAVPGSPVANAQVELQSVKKKWKTHGSCASWTLWSTRRGDAIPSSLGELSILRSEKRILSKKRHYLVE